jgi:DNA-binding IclR family transcriptional regulator
VTGAQDATRVAIEAQLRHLNESIPSIERDLMESLAARDRLTAALAAWQSIRGDLEGPVQPFAEGELRDRILAVVAGGRLRGGWRASQVCAQMGVSDADLVRRNLRGLAEQGLLAKDAHRQYRLRPMAGAGDPVT